VACRWRSAMDRSATVAAPAARLPVAMRVVLNVAIPRVGRRTPHVRRRAAAAAARQGRGGRRVRATALSVVAERIECAERHVMCVAVATSSKRFSLGLVCTHL